MTAAAILTPAARAAAAEAAGWLAEDNPAAARRLRAAILEAAHLIGARPAVGRRQPALVGERYRLWSLTAFPYLLIYDPTLRPPHILRILHTARDLPPLLADLRD